MRIHSTRESVAAGEVSVLAIVETLAAMSLSVWIAVHFDILKHIAISACIAPLLLLRTGRSVESGIKVFDRLLGRVLATFRWPPNRVVLCIHPFSLRFAWILVWKSIVLLFGLLLATAFGPLSRVLATLFTVFCHPICAVRAMPGNWLRITCWVDTCHKPEVVPEYHAKGRFRGLVFSEAIYPGYCGKIRLYIRRRGNKKSTRTFVRPLHPTKRLSVSVVDRLVWLILLFLPAWTYRWSLKSTSLIYTPLLWVIWLTFREIHDLKEELRRLRVSDIARITVIYSLIALFAFAVKVAFMMTWSDFSVWWNSVAPRRLFAFFVAPDELPIWQCAAAINAVLAIGLFVFAGMAHLRWGETDAWSHAFVERVLRCTTVVRCLLTLYTVSCTLYITVQAASDWNLPRLGTKLFPWW